MSDCIFCKIIHQTEEASIVYQDDSVIAIMDAYPLSEGHCLVIPKEHCVRLDELEGQTRNALFDVAHHVIQAQKSSGYGVSGTNLLLNDGKAANQTVPHVHIHLIPRDRGDLLWRLPKLALHISGLFGLKAKRPLLDRQAREISSHIVR